MKNLFFIMAVLLVFNNIASAAYCPTADEFRAKSRYFQNKALNLMSSQSSNLDEAESLLDEQARYLDSLYPNCMQYFRTTPKPDCDRLNVLTTAYYMLDKSKQPAAKNQIYNMLLSLPVSCESAIQATKLMIK